MWAMGGYGVYIWPAYGLVFAGLVLMIVLSLNDAKKQRTQRLRKTHVPKA